MSIEDFELAFDALPPEMQKRGAIARDAILRWAAEKQAGKAIKRRLPWLNSSLRKFLRGEADRPCLPSLVPEYFLDHDFISQSEASERCDYLLSRGPGINTERKLSVETRYPRPVALPPHLSSDRYWPPPGLASHSKEGARNL